MEEVGEASDDIFDFPHVKIPSSRVCPKDFLNESEDEDPDPHSEFKSLEFKMPPASSPSSSGLDISRWDLRSRKNGGQVKRLREEEDVTLKIVNKSLVKKPDRNEYDSGDDRKIENESSDKAEGAIKRSGKEKKKHPKKNPAFMVKMSDVQEDFIFGERIYQVVK